MADKIGRYLPLEILESIPKLAAQHECLLFPIPAVQTSIGGDSERLLSANSGR